MAKIFPDKPRNYVVAFSSKGEATKGIYAITRIANQFLDNFSAKFFRNICATQSPKEIKGRALQLTKEGRGVEGKLAGKHFRGMGGERHVSLAGVGTGESWEKRPGAFVLTRRFARQRADMNSRREGTEVRLSLNLGSKFVGSKTRGVKLRERMVLEPSLAVDKRGNVPAGGGRGDVTVFLGSL
jgi:hypothetical protein